MRPDPEHPTRVSAAWYPAEEPIVAAGAKKTRIRRPAFSLFNYQLKGPHSRLVRHDSQSVPSSVQELGHPLVDLPRESILNVHSSCPVVFFSSPASASLRPRHRKRSNWALTVSAVERCPARLRGPRPSRRWSLSEAGTTSGHSGQVRLEKRLPVAHRNAPDQGRLHRRDVVIHQTVSGQSAEVAATVFGRTIRDVGFGQGVWRHAGWTVYRAGVAADLSFVQPVVIALTGTVKGGLDERSKENR